MGTEPRHPEDEPLTAEWMVAEVERFAGEFARLIWGRKK
jgi:hypothetical protein